jgi:hypothetical protein
MARKALKHDAARLGAGHVLVIRGVDVGVFVLVMTRGGKLTKALMWR